MKSESSRESVARELRVLAELIEQNESQDSESIRELVMEAVSSVLAALGLRLGSFRTEGGRAVGEEPAFRVEGFADYAIHDTRLASGVLRSSAKKLGRGLCTAEPLDEDPMGVLMDLLDLEIPLSQTHGSVEVINFHRFVRALTSSERKAES